MEKKYGRVYGFDKPDMGITVAGLVLSAVLIIFYFASGTLCFERMYYTVKCLPYVFGLLSVLPFAAWLANVFFIRSRPFNVICLTGAAAGIAGHFVMVAYIVSKLFYFLSAGMPYFIAAGFVLIILAVVFSHKMKRRARVATALAMSFVFLIFALTDLFNLRIMYFNSDAVVFAVGDEYQICWSTSAPSTGSVEINGSIYYDDTAGTKDVSTLHKVTVPCEKLHESGTYKIVSEQVFTPRSYFPVGGKTICRSYTFRQPDTSDGLQIYNISDNHLLNRGAAAAGRFWGERLDLLVANGDHINDLESKYEITVMYRLLAEVTESRRPIIISRGNHETAGTLAGNYSDYIGSRDGTFYYTTRIGDVLFLVLDIASCETDGNAVIRTVANYDEYRRAELEWLEKTVEEYTVSRNGIKRIIAVCHVAYGIRRDRYFPETSARIIELTERMNVDMLLTGHIHKTEFHYGGAAGNYADYPVVAGSVRSDEYADKESISAHAFTGTALEITDDRITVMFTNSNGEVKGKYEIAQRRGRTS